MALKPPFSRQSPVGPMYRLDMFSGTLASNTTGGLVGTMSSALFTMQWASTKRIMQITAIEFDWMWAVGTVTTASPMAFGAYFVRGYTVVASGTTLATVRTGRYVARGCGASEAGIGTQGVYSEFTTEGSMVGAVGVAGTT